MKRERKVYIVMGYEYKNKVTYVSEVCSSKKKAEHYKKWISHLMAKEEGEFARTYWIYDARVA